MHLAFPSAIAETFVQPLSFGEESLLQVPDQLVLGNNAMNYFKFRERHQQPNQRVRLSANRKYTTNTLTKP